MNEKWFRGLRLPMTEAQFTALPRNAAFRYEWVEGEARITPRPRYYHALLSLETWPPPDPADAAVRPLGPDDWDKLAPLFVAAFASVPPFRGLVALELAEAARSCLEQTRTGGDGPLIEAACFVAEKERQVCGAVLVTLVPLVDPSGGEPLRWHEPPPADAIERRLGQPHLTWVFVDPVEAGGGVGTALLAAAVKGLLGLGYGELVSTFLAGNESSALWHWRNGFRLLPHVLSPRELRRRWNRGPE
jgi:GNAT superfamily N-acetyltransferase